MELDLDLMREKSGTVPPRPFQLSDSMILMAALFVALAWDRGRLLDPMHWTLVTTPGSKGIAWRVAIGAANVIELLTPFLTVGSVALLVLRLRKPRPAGHLLLRQPGTVACAVASVCMVPAVLAVLASHVAS